MNDANRTIFAQIRSEIKDFNVNYVSIVPGYSFSQIYTLKRIHLYLNSRYESGTNIGISTGNTTNTDIRGSQYLGRDKLFFNIVTPICELAAKELNLDTKDIKLRPLEPKSYFSTYLLEKELKQWLKKNKLGKVLNLLAEEAPKYGSVVLVKTADGAEVVDLRRLILDPTVETIGKSRFVTTIHYMTPTELRETGWDNVEQAIERFGERNQQEPFQDQYGNTGNMTSTPYIKVHKRYGEVPKWWIDDKAKPGTKDGDAVVKSLFIVAGSEVLQHNAENKVVGELGVILFKSRWYKEWPLKDFHYTKVRGRWLGLGVVEMLFDDQVRMNELKNQKRISMEISAMHLFQTPDKQIVRNLLTDLESGDLLISKGNITPIANEERNLPAFQEEEQSYSSHADRLTFAFSALRGEAPMRREGIGLYNAQAAQANSVFGFKKENLGLFLQEFFNDLVMPNLMKDLTPEHIMRFTGSMQELQKLDQAAAEIFANDTVKDRILNGVVSYKEDLDALKKKAVETYQRNGVSRFIKIKEQFYKDVEFEFDFLITKDQADQDADAQKYQEVWTALAKDKTILDDPRVKLLFYKYAENRGVNPAELELADQEHQQNQQNAQPQQKLPSESISFKDLPPEGQVQMAGQAGIKIAPPQPQPSPLQPNPMQPNQPHPTR